VDNKYKKEIAINYPPDFAVRWGYGKPKAYFVEKIFIHNLDKQLDFALKINSQISFFEKIDVEATDNIEPFWKQNWFPPLDGMSLYTILTHYKPAQYFEIGSGNSTKFAYRAIRDHQLETHITSIDPTPRAEIDHISGKVIRQRIEAVDLEIFDRLQANDVVFFDGSHRSFQNSDVTVFFIDILPRLASGVIVGIHDIFWPSDYPDIWITRYYNEQYLLAAYMLAQKEEFPLIFGCNWMANNYQANVSQNFTTLFNENLLLANKTATGECLWFSIK
jgi:hypothetical protein